MKKITIEIPDDTNELDFLCYVAAYGKQTAPVEVKRSEAEEILDFLNKKTGKSFRPVAANIEPIRQRLKEGATVGEMKAVIAIKSRDWASDKKMMEYLRPATLFNKTKFWQYHGKIGV